MMNVLQQSSDAQSAELVTALTSCDGLAEQAVQVSPEAHAVLPDVVDLLDLGQNLPLTHDKGVKTASNPA